MRTRQAFFQRVSASLIVPITFLPLAAILLALGSQLGIAPVEAAGKALLQLWLPLFFGIGISIGFTESDGMGVLSVTAGFLVMNAVAGQVSGDPGLNVGVLGGIVAGGVCTWLYKRVKHVALPEYLALFSGKRMGPLVAASAGVALGYLFGFTWPPAYRAVVAAGEWMYGAGGVGVFAYGSALRLLIPTGLHHILMQLVDTQVGGWTDPVSGKVVFGEYVRFLAGDPAAGRILSGFFLTLGFGPLGAALAITREARPEQRRRVAGLMTTGALTAMVLGVTEPIEFAFIFASPLLFGLHVLLSGLASLVAWMLDIHLGGYALPMILINWHKQQNGLLLFPLGLLWTALYYYGFRAVIRWLRPPILGQVAGEDSAVAADTPPAPDDDPGAAFLAALGGAGNVVRVEACMTRLRLEVREPHKVDEARLKQLGASGTVRPGGGHELQVVVGTRADMLAGGIRRAMEGLVAPAAAAKAPGSAEPPGQVGEVIICSPMTGRIVPLDQVPDPVFAGRLAGDGVAIDPDEGTLVSPADGIVAVVFPGGHAVGVSGPGGLELLLHVGIDTVALHGEGFSPNVSEGAKVQVGDLLGRFDTAFIRSQGKSLVSPVLLTSLDRVAAWELVPAGPSVRAGQPLYRVWLKPGV